MTGVPPATTAGQGEPLATIGAVVLTTGDIEKRLNEQSPFVRARYQSEERKQEFLDNQVRFEVLAHEAYRRGYDREPEVVEAVKKILVQRLTREEFDGRVNLKDITDEQIAAYYESHRDDYNKPEMIRVSHIFVAFGDDRTASRARADEAQRTALEKSKSKEERDAFKALVAQFSEDEESKRNGGDLRYLAASEVEERFGTAAKDAVLAINDMNQISGVVEGKTGWHVFQRTGTRKAIERDLEQVKNQIRNVLYRERRTESFQEFVKGLEQQLGVKTYPDRLKDVKVDATMPVAPGAPGHGHGGMPGIDLPAHAPAAEEAR
ncbi:MAG: peptidylprolyl isomerase [Myxococcota bacterium]